ncbi:hypothetical protein FRB99_008889 [Tulasnella sp. 403]|nr:hypothetical protein FRB99_008889 [Tulasnella sp. 403]
MSTSLRTNVYLPLQNPFQPLPVSQPTSIPTVPAPHFFDLQCDSDEDDADVGPDDDPTDEYFDQAQNTPYPAIVPPPIPTHSRPHHVSAPVLSGTIPVANTARPGASRAVILPANSHLPKNRPRVQRKQTTGITFPPPSRPSHARRPSGPSQLSALGSVTGGTADPHDPSLPDPTEEGIIMISGEQAMSMVFTDFQSHMFLVRKDLTESLYPSRLEPPSKLTPLRCLFCKKVYNGPNARSMWRRHITQKHGFVLGGKKGNGKGRRDVVLAEDDNNPGENVGEASLHRKQVQLQTKREWARNRRSQDKLGETPQQPQQLFPYPASADLQNTQTHHQLSQQDLPIQKRFEDIMYWPSSNPTLEMPPTLPLGGFIDHTLVGLHHISSEYEFDFGFTSNELSTSPVVAMASSMPVLSQPQDQNLNSFPQVTDYFTQPLVNEGVTGPGTPNKKADSTVLTPDANAEKRRLILSLESPTSYPMLFSRTNSGLLSRAPNLSASSSTSSASSISLVGVSQPDMLPSLSHSGSSSEDDSSGPSSAESSFASLLHSTPGRPALNGLDFLPTPLRVTGNGAWVSDSPVLKRKREHSEGSAPGGRNEQVLSSTAFNANGGDGHPLDGDIFERWFDLPKTPGKFNGHLSAGGSENIKIVNEEEEKRPAKKTRPVL